MALGQSVIILQWLVYNPYHNQLKDTIIQSHTVAYGT